MVYVVMLDKNANVCYNKKVECIKSVQETSNLERKERNREVGEPLKSFFVPNGLYIDVDVYEFDA